MSSFVRSLTIELFNASGADIAIAYGMLTGGEWEAAPAPGTIIAATQKQSYVNGAANVFTSLGGQILLTPAAGGTISPSWSWASGGPVSGSVNNVASNLLVSSQFINVQSNSPIMQVLITNAASAAQIRAAVTGA